MLRADFHTHTCFCDGADSPRTMVESAFRMGLTDYGISGHAYFPFGGDFGMSEENYQTYREEIRNLQEEYRGRMNLYFGIELDSLGPLMEADYTIGSVHCLKKNGTYVVIDESREMLCEAAERLYNGDFYAMTTAYYEEEARVIEHTHCDFIGHFDLITKFNQDFCLFDERKDEYLEPALTAMKKLNEAEIPFEINTGAISRGYRKEPYPSAILLRELYLMGGRIVINSDSHRADTICYHFNETVALAKRCGFTKTNLLTPNGGWREVPL